jgi:hypothetical protein
MGKRNLLRRFPRMTNCSRLIYGAGRVECSTLNSQFRSRFSLNLAQIAALAKGDQGVESSERSSTTSATLQTLRDRSGIIKPLYRRQSQQNAGMRLCNGRAITSHNIHPVALWVKPQDRATESFQS